MGKATDSPFSYGPHYDAATGKTPHCVGIRCRCGKEDHAAAPSVGYGRRIFKDRGWHVADRMGRHDCPDCVASKKVSRIEVAPVGPVAVQPAPEAPVINTVMADKLGEAALNRFQMAAAQGGARRGAESGFRLNYQAMAAARRAATRNGVRNPVRGVHYDTKEDEDGTFSFVLLENLTGSDSEAPAAEKKVHGQTGVTKGRYTSKGAPPVMRPYTARATAQKVARRYFTRLGVTEPKEGKHFSTYRKGTARGWWVAILDPRGIPAGGLPEPMAAMEYAPRGKTFPSKTFSNRWNAARAARNFLALRINVPPREDIHYSLTGSDDDSWTVTILDPRGKTEAPPVPKEEAQAVARPVTTLTKNWGYLSSFDAKKAVFGHFDRIGRTSGAPVQNVDYWLTQDARNLWGYTLTDPNPNPEPVAPEIAPEPPKEAATVSDASTQAVRDLEESRANPPAEVRQPTLQDNRRIRSEIEDKYDESKQMYVGNWTDKLLAEELKVPRAWVTRVREMYGPDQNNDAAIRAAAAKLQAAQRVQGAIDLAAKATSISNTILELAATLEGVMADLKLKQAEIG